MTVSRIILATLILALLAGAGGFPAHAEEDDTQWLDERREERLEKMRKERRERTKRDPLEPLYVPQSSGSSGLSRPSPQNPVAPSGSLPKRPWNTR